MTIDKKTAALLKTLEKDHGCNIVKSPKKATLMVKHPNGRDQLLIHVNHLATEKTFHPLRRWAKRFFQI